MCKNPVYIPFFPLFSQWAEYILFAALLFAVTIIFAIMAYFYTYVDPAEVEAQFAEEEKKKEKDQLEKEKHIYENEVGSELQTNMWKYVWNQNKNVN